MTVLAELRPLKAAKRSPIPIESKGNPWSDFLMVIMADGICSRAHDDDGDDGAVFVYSFCFLYRFCDYYTQNRRPNNIHKTSPQSYKTQIKIQPYPRLA